MCDVLHYTLEMTRYQLYLFAFVVLDLHSLLITESKIMIYLRWGRWWLSSMSAVFIHTRI